MDTNLVAAVTQVGFPIVMTLYLLTRFQKSIDNLALQISELVKEIQQERWK